eukprot:13315035-Alexandrium_andersonii.AAC.1
MPTTCASFQEWGSSSPLKNLVNSWANLYRDSLPSHLRSSGGTSSGPGDFPSLTLRMAYSISGSVTGPVND